MGRRKKKATSPHQEYAAEKRTPLSLADSQYVPRESNTQQKSKTHVDTIESLEHATGSHVFCAMILDRVEDLENQLLSVQHTDRHLHMDELFGHREKIKLMECEAAEQRARCESLIARCTSNEMDVQSLRQRVSADLQPSTWQLVLLMIPILLGWFGICIYSVTQIVAAVVSFKESVI